MDDPHKLQRFVDAQDPLIDHVRAELGAGRKRSHWMWFVFPQMRGLGRSAMARDFGIASRAEAAAYLGHPVLGPRLHECCRLLLNIEGRSALEILGSPDDLKCRSCMTLFAAVAVDDDVFDRVLQKYFGGERCQPTLELLSEPDGQ
ncbi:MAG TPA: DUF1810 domain-containing protein [Vineibacter sp.]|nr:DUF1810 domain-containing protein [Vineibacter sp.]